MGQPQERDPTSKKENEIGPIIPDMMMQSTSHQYGHPTNVTPRDGNPSEERIQLEGGATLNGVKPNDVLCGRGKESFNHGESQSIVRTSELCLWTVNRFSPMLCLILGFNSG